MRSIIFGICAIVIQISGAMAGANGGGTLLLHALNVAYTTDGDYCQEPVPRDCESVNPRSSGAEIQIYNVLAVFSEGNKPRLRGVEFGISYSAVGIEDYGACSDFDYPMPGWPLSGLGTVVTWSEAQTDRITPVYWFAGYLASLASPPTFELIPHPENGGHFGDDHVPTHLDEIAGYGALGFGGDGVAPCPAPRTFVIRPDGTGDVPTIQAAIYLAAPGSVIELEDGVYRGSGNRDILLNDTHLTVRSQSGNPNACVIDCEGSPAQSHRAFLLGSDERARPTIEGIKIVNGYCGADLQFDASGAGITGQGGSSYVLRNCIVEGCSARWVSGAVGAGGTLLAEDCIFRNNTARERDGGAIYTNGERITLRRCRFEGNHAAIGGGAIQSNGATVELEDCVFVDNSADRGGALRLEFAPATLTRCTLAGNSAPIGGGMYVNGGDVSIEQSTFSDNTATNGAGIYCDAATGTLALRSSIISFAGNGGAFRCGSNTVTVEASDVYGNVGGDWPSCLIGQSHTNGNFSADPLYCNRPGRDYRLDASSPCAEGADPERGQVGAWAVGCGEVSDALVPAIASGPVSGLRKVAPNPFDGVVEIEYALDGAALEAIDLKVFDASGRLVRRLAHQVQTPGLHIVRWDGRDDSDSPAVEGVYFVRLSVGAKQTTSRLLLIR